MPPKIDLAGQRFGKLIVAKEIGIKNNRPLWECTCDCGNVVFRIASELRRGKALRCPDCAAASKIKHGCSHSKNQTVSREYRTWNSLRKRCMNPKDKNYHHYGGRGISVDPRWDDFRIFFLDMGPCPKGHTLDRIDVNGPYSVTNCRWATPKTQANNRRDNRRMEYGGELLTMAEWADRLGVSRAYISNSVGSGYSISQIMDRLNTGAKYKKLNYRGENSAAATLTGAVVDSIVAEYTAIPDIGSRKPKGSRAAIAAKYGITEKYLGCIVGGRTNWTGKHIKGYKRECE